jgi:hypothetical protein
LGKRGDRAQEASKIEDLRRMFQHLELGIGLLKIGPNSY